MVANSVNGGRVLERNAKRRSRNRRIMIIAAALFAVIPATWVLNGILLHSCSERGTFGDMFGAVNALFSGLAFAGVVVAILLQQQEMSESREEFIESANEQREFYEAERREHTKGTADAVFREWWSPKLNSLRRYFYQEFLPTHYARAVRSRWGLKELEHQIPDDRGRLQKLTSFFDRVGWLGAAGLVDVDYMLGPMQHSMRRVWLASEPLVKATRKLHSPGQLDPVYRLGFEWLFLRSETPEKGHARLLGDRFQHPALFGDEDVSQLNEAIASDEEQFRQYLSDLIDNEGGQSCDA